MPTDVEHFAKGHAKPKPKTKVRPKTPRNPTTEHEGRVSQPGVPSGPRNSAGGTKTVATVHPDGHVTAKGPESAKAKREAEASVRRLKAVHNYRREEGEDKSGPLPDIPKAVKKVVSTLERQDPSSKPVRDLAEGEAKNLVKVAKENLTGSNAVRQLKGVPDADEIRAAAAITAPVAGDARVAGEAAAAGRSAVSKAAEKAADETANLAERVKTKPGRVVQSVKDAPTKAKEFPGKVKDLPKDVRDALETPDARRATAKAAGKTAVRHPIKTGVPAAAILPPGVIPGDASDRARALLTGLARASTHPGDLATATAHGVLGAFTAPLAVTASAIESAKQGNIGPLTDELGTLAGGVEDLGKKLISGNPKEVEETFRKELGVTPFIPAGALAREVKESDTVDSVVGSVRGKVDARRATKRDKLVKEKGKLEDEGAFVSPKFRKKLDKLNPVEDSKRGGNYVNRKVGSFTEKQRARHDVSRIVHRIESSGNHAAKGWAQRVSKIIRKSKLSKRDMDTVADAQRIFNKYGIPVDESGKSFVRMLHEAWPELKKGDIPDGAHVDRHSTKYLLDHPEAFDDPHLKAAVEEFDKASEPVGTSPRNRHLAVTNQILNPLRKAEGKRPILLPEEQVTPATADLMDKLVKGRDPEKDPWTRDEVLDYAKELKGEDGKALRQQIEGTLTDDEGNLLMRSPKHGGAEGGVSTTRSVSYTPEMEQKFVDQAKSEEARHGLREPSAYVADKVPDSLRDVEKLPNFAASVPLNKIWPSRGLNAASGNALSDFEHFLHDSIEAPRHRTALVKGFNVIIDKASRKIEGNRAFTDDEARRLINEHKVPPNTAWVRKGVLTRALEGHHTLDSEGFTNLMNGELDAGQKLSNGEELASDIKGLDNVKGEKLVPADEHYMKEFLAHMKPVEGVTAVAAKGTRYASRAILNSPAFAAIQAAQEGIPLAAALSRDVLRVPEAIKNLSKAKDLDPDQVADFKAASGSSAGLFGSPSQAELRADGYLDPIRQTAPLPVWRKLVHLIDGHTLGVFDRNRAGLMRELGVEARTLGDLKRAQKGFNTWSRGTTNMFKGLDKAVEDLKGKDFEERQAYISKHPELEDRLQKAADSMAGNWNSFTVFEKHFAPLTMFYTFQRYSALWMLYHFPLDHPIAATALTMLGQVNAKELQKAAAAQGAVPSILDYTIPVYQRGEGKEPGLLPAGKRAFPGLSTLQQSAITGESNQLVGEIPPWLAVPVEAALGKESFSGRDIEENGFAFMGKSFANLSPAYRLFMGLNGGKRSAAGEAFHKQDPLSEWRSVVDPYIGQTAKQFGKTKKLEKDFDTKYGEGKVPDAFDSKAVQNLLFENTDGHVDPKKLQALIKKIHKSEAASASIKKAEAEAGEQDSEFTPEQDEALQEIEDAWKTGPSGETSSSGGGNPFTEALAKSKGSTGPNPFSKALSESSTSSGPNPFSAALAGAR